MGVSYDKHRTNRAKPWPRYRVSWFGEVSMAWHDLPRIHLDLLSTLTAAKKRDDLGDKVRVCVMRRDGTKEDIDYKNFQEMVALWQKRMIKNQT